MERDLSAPRRQGEPTDPASEVLVKVRAISSVEDHLVGRADQTINDGLVMSDHFPVISELVRFE